MSKQKVLNLFMTEKDYQMFQEFVSKNNILLIDTKPSKNHEINQINQVYEAKGSEAVLLNKDIMPKESYEKLVVQIADFFHYPNIGKGIVQLLKSTPATYDKNCLKDGRIAISYDDDDAQTAQWTTEILNWLKKVGQKVYRIAPSRGIIADKPEKDYYALPDAASTYDGSGSKYLTIVKDVLCIAK